MLLLLLFLVIAFLEFFEIIEDLSDEFLLENKLLAFVIFSFVGFLPIMTASLSMLL